MTDSSPPPVVDSTEDPEETQLLAEVVVSLPGVYANHVALTGMVHELVLDFFEVLPIGVDSALSGMRAE